MPDLYHRMNLSVNTWATMPIYQSYFTRILGAMLLEEGFEMVSSDASDKMLKEAYKTRWDRRKEPAFDKWSEFFLRF